MNGGTLIGYLILILMIVGTLAPLASRRFSRSSPTALKAGGASNPASAPTVSVGPTRHIQHTAELSQTGWTAVSRAGLTLDIAASATPEELLGAVRNAAARPRRGVTELLTGPLLGANIYIERELPDRLVLSINTGNRLVELCTFAAVTSVQNGRTHLRVGGLETYKTSQETLFGFIPLGPKSISGYGIYKHFLREIIVELNGPDGQSGPAVNPAASGGSAGAGPVSTSPAPAAPLTSSSPITLARPNPAQPAVPAGAVCSACQAVSPPGGRFCGDCGAPMSASTPAPPPAAYPTPAAPPATYPWVAAVEAAGTRPGNSEGPTPSS